MTSLVDVLLDSPLKKQFGQLEVWITKVTWPQINDQKIKVFPPVKMNLVYFLFPILFIIII